MFQSYQVCTCTSNSYSSIYRCDSVHVETNLKYYTNQLQLGMYNLYLFSRINATQVEAIRENWSCEQTLTSEQPADSPPSNHIK